MDHGPKGLCIDVKQAWSRVLQKSSSLVAAIKAVYMEVAEPIEKLVSGLGNTEIRVIHVALANHHRVNHAFDLLGLTYPDWPLVELKEARGSKKRKRFEASGKLTSAPMQGRHGHGHAGMLKVSRVVTVTVPASSVGSSTVATKPKSVVMPVLRPSIVGGVHQAWKLPTLIDLPILQVISNDEDEEEGEKERARALEVARG